MNRLRTWGIFLLVLLVLAGAGYRIFMPKTKETQPVHQPTEPQTDVDPVNKENQSKEDTQDLLPQVQFGVIDLPTVRQQHPRYKMITQLEKQIQGYIDEKDSQQDEWKRAQNQIANQYTELNTQLVSQIEGVRDQYQQKIIAKTEELQLELARFEEQIWNDALNEMNQKKEDMQEMAQGMVSRQYDQQMEKLAEIEEELSREYSHQILNLRLKLSMVELTEEEQKKYKEEMDELQLEWDQKLDEAKAKLEEEVNTYIGNKQSELDKELQDYQTQEKQAVEKAREEKHQELDLELQAYIKKMEDAMQAEIQQKQTKMEEQANNGLLKAKEDMQNELQNSEQLLATKVEEAKKEIEKTQAEIDQEIRATVAELAQEQDIDVVLTEVRVNVHAVNLTEQVIEKLN